MLTLTFLISVVALIVAIMAFRRAGGQIDIAQKVESLSQVTDNLREKTADLLAKMEAALRKKEEKSEEQEK